MPQLPSMSPETFMEQAVRTLRQGPRYLEQREAQLLVGALNAMEAGEVLNLIKKHLFQGHPLNTGEVMDEVGDALWGLAIVAHACGFTLSQAMRANGDKLLKNRYRNGYSEEASVNRDIEAEALAIDNAIPTKSFGSTKFSYGGNKPKEENK